MFKKLLKGVFVLTAVLMLNNPAHAFYSDMDENHWAYQSIKFLTEVGVVVGYPDGTYKPDIPVTRAEFASMAIKALGQEDASVTQDIHFSDVKPDFWAYDIIKKAVYFDLVTDSENAQFRPYDSVTRAEAISIAVNALTTQQISEQKAQEILEKSYEDYTQIPAWFLLAAGKAQLLDMIIVMPGNEGKLEAERPANRAEVAAILYKMMQEAKLNPNAKLAESMQKRTAEGINRTDGGGGEQGLLPGEMPVERVALQRCGDRVRNALAQLGRRRVGEGDYQQFRDIDRIVRVAQRIPEGLVEIPRRKRVNRKSEHRDHRGDDKSAQLEKFSAHASNPPAIRCREIRLRLQNAGRGRHCRLHGICAARTLPLPRARQL